MISKKAMTLSFYFGLKEKLWQDYVHKQTKPQTFVDGKSAWELGTGMVRFGLAAVIVRTSSAMMIDFGVRCICNKAALVLSSMGETLVLE